MRCESRRGLILDNPAAGIAQDGGALQRIEDAPGVIGKPEQGFFKAVRVLPQCGHRPGPFARSPQAYSDGRLYHKRLFSW